MSFVIQHKNENYISKEYAMGFKVWTDSKEMAQRFASREDAQTAVSILFAHPSIVDIKEITPPEPEGV